MTPHAHQLLPADVTAVPLILRDIVWTAKRQPLVCLTGVRPKVHI